MAATITTDERLRATTAYTVVPSPVGPLTLAGNEVKVGQQAPDFKLHYFEGGLKELKLSDLKGKPTILSVVPSLDTWTFVGRSTIETRTRSSAIFVDASPHWYSADADQPLVLTGTRDPHDWAAGTYRFVISRRLPSGGTVPAGRYRLLVEARTPEGTPISTRSGLFTLR